EQTSNLLRVFLFVGIFLWVIPPFFIAAAAKYQQELTWGTGQISVFMEYFGVSFLICTLLMFISKRITPAKERYRFISAAIACLFAFLITATFTVNRYVAHSALLKRQMHGWRTATAAFQSKLLKSVPENAFIFEDIDYLCTSDDFYYAYTGRNF